MDSVEIKIDDKSIKAKEGTKILQAALDAEFNPVDYWRGFFCPPTLGKPHVNSVRPKYGGHRPPYGISEPPFDILL